MNLAFLFIQKHFTKIKLLFILFSALYILFKGIIPGWNEVQQDFPNYLISAKILAEGSDIDKLYDDNWFQSQVDASGINTMGRFTPQPPIMALVMLPIAQFEPLTAKRIWLIFSLILVAGCIFLIQQIFHLSFLDSSLVILLMGRALANDLYYGQLYILMAFGMMFSFWLIQEKKMFLSAGIILAVITFLKYFPILLILYCLIESKWKVIISSVSALILLAVFQIWFFEFELVKGYVVEILLPHLSGNIPDQGEGFPFAFQSWPSFLNNLFVFNQSENNSPIINWAFGKTLFQIAIYSIVITVTCKYVIHIKKNIQSSSLRASTLISLLIIASLVLLPASASYHMLFLIIPVSFILGLKNDIYKVSMIFLVIAINFFPFPFSSNDNLLFLILSFPRLFALLTILITFYLKISQDFRKIETIN